MQKDKSFTKTNHMQYGECQPIPDHEFYKLLTTDIKGKTDQTLVEIALKYYPALTRFRINEEVIHFIRQREKIAI